MWILSGQEAPRTYTAAGFAALRLTVGERNDGIMTAV